MSEEKKAGRQKAELFSENINKELDRVKIDKTEIMGNEKKEGAKTRKYRTKEQIKKDKKVKTFMDKGKSDLTLNIQKRSKKKTGIYKYIELTPEMIVDLDELRLDSDNAFRENEDGYITKSEIIAGSAFRVYVEQELLEEKHVIFLYFLKKCFGNYSRACDRMGISRRTPLVWEEHNSIFKAIIEDFKEGFLDDTEEALHLLIQQGNIQAVMFYLKTKGKQRGYVEKQTIEMLDKTEVIGFEFIDVNNTEDEDTIEAELEEQLKIENKG